MWRKWSRFLHILSGGLFFPPPPSSTLIVRREGMKGKAAWAGAAAGSPGETYAVQLSQWIFTAFIWPTGAFPCRLSDAGSANTYTFRGSGNKAPSTFCEYSSTVFAVPKSPKLWKPRHFHLSFGLQWTHMELLTVFIYLLTACFTAKILICLIVGYYPRFYSRSHTFLFL